MKTKTLILSLLLLTILSVPVFSCLADGFDYKLLESLPGSDYKAGESSPGFNSYISAIYRFALWAVGISALLMISIGAFMYLTSAGNNAAMGNAKNVITDAIIGLALALLAWLLLYTINPDLVNPKGISGTSGGTTIATTPTTTTPGATTAPTTTTGEVYSHQEAFDYLKKNGISVVSSGGCLGQNAAGCTTLEGLPKQTAERLVSLKNGSGVSFSVSGGTETTGHNTHGPGKPIVDVQLSNNNDISKFNSYLQSNRSSLGITTIYSSSGVTDNKNVSEKTGVYHLEMKG